MNFLVLPSLASFTHSHIRREGPAPAKPGFNFFILTAPDEPGSENTRGFFEPKASESFALAAMGPFGEPGDSWDLPESRTGSLSPCSSRNDEIQLMTPVEVS